MTSLTKLKFLKAQADIHPRTLEKLFLETTKFLLQGQEAMSLTTIHVHIM